MSDSSGTPKDAATHHKFRDVRIQHGGKRWSASWYVADGWLVVISPWGSESEPIGGDTDPASRAAELLHAAVAGRAWNDPGQPLGF